MGFDVTLITSLLPISVMYIGQLIFLFWGLALVKG